MKEIDGAVVSRPLRVMSASLRHIRVMTTDKPKAQRTCGAQKNTGPAVEPAVALTFACDELEELLTGLEAGAEALTPAKTRREDDMAFIRGVAED